MYESKTTFTTFSQAAPKPEAKIKPGLKILPDGSTGYLSRSGWFTPFVPDTEDFIWDGNTPLAPAFAVRAEDTGPMAPGLKVFADGELAYFSGKWVTPLGTGVHPYPWDGKTHMAPVAVVSADSRKKARPESSASSAEDSAPASNEAASEPQAAPAPVQDDSALQDMAESLRRVSAEYKNYRNRAARDKDNAKLEGIQSVFSTLVPTLDALDAAIAAGDMEADSALGRIHANMLQALEAKGLMVISEDGVDFDPNVHEAVMKQEIDGMEPEKVAKVLRSGFVTEFSVIRAATVIVSG